jgi:hypothetical protein
MIFSLTNVAWYKWYVSKINEWHTRACIPNPNKKHYRYDRWRSFVCDLQQPYNLFPTAIQTISNNHTNDLQRPYKRSSRAMQTISNGHSNDLQRPYKRSSTAIQTIKLIRKCKRSPTAIQTISNSHTNDNQDEIVCMVVGDRLYGRWRSFV